MSPAAAIAPDTMRAVLCEAFGPPGSTRLAEVARPPADDAHTVTLAVEYASVSHATGLMVAGRYQTRPPLPFVPGTEAVGRVLSCGAGVTRLRPGDRAVAIADWGCFGEVLRLPEYTVYPVPDALEAPAGAASAAFLWHRLLRLVWRCALQAGETVLVLGAGAGVGLAAVEIAHQLGATVIACASTEAKRAEALRRGAAHAVAPQDLAARVKQLTGGRGADVVADPVGGDLFDRPCGPPPPTRACSASASPAGASRRHRSTCCW